MSLQSNKTLYQTVFDSDTTATERAAGLDINRKEQQKNRTQNEAEIDFDLWHTSPSESKTLYEKSMLMISGKDDETEEEDAKKEIRRMQEQSARAQEQHILEAGKKKYVPKYGEIGHSIIGGCIVGGNPKSDVDWAILRAKRIPGPGAYKLPNLQEESLGGKFSTAVPKSDLDFQIIEAKSQPGPGQYTLPPALNQTGGTFSIGVSKSELDWTIYRAGKIPGPGEYSTPSTLNTTGGRWGRQITKSEIDKTIERAKLTPGPGEYYIDDTSSNARGGTWSTANPKNYLDWIIHNGKQTPGPGTYVFFLKYFSKIHTINTPAPVLAGSQTVVIQRDPSIPWYERMYNDAHKAGNIRLISGRELLFGNPENDVQKEHKSNKNINNTNHDNKEDGEVESKRIIHQNPVDIELSAAAIQRNRARALKKEQEDKELDHFAEARYEYSQWLANEEEKLTGNPVESPIKEKRWKPFIGIQRLKEYREVEASNSPTNRNLIVESKAYVKSNGPKDAFGDLRRAQQIERRQRLTKKRTGNIVRKKQNVKSGKRVIRMNEHHWEHSAKARERNLFRMKNPSTLLQPHGFKSKINGNSNQQQNLSKLEKFAKNSKSNKYQHSTLDTQQNDTVQNIRLTSYDRPILSAEELAKRRADIRKQFSRKFSCKSSNRRRNNISSRRSKTSRSKRSASSKGEQNNREDKSVYTSKFRHLDNVNTLYALRGNSIMFGCPSSIDSSFTI